MQGGQEWICEVQGCASEPLSGQRGKAVLQGLFADLIARLDLHPVGEPVWHVFGGPAGVTGLVALSESHLACHSYPESGYLSLNLYTCRERPGPDWQAVFEAHLGACQVDVRRVRRGPRALTESEA